MKRLTVFSGDDLEACFNEGTLKYFLKQPKTRQLQVISETAGIRAHRLYASLIRRIPRLYLWRFLEVRRMAGDPAPPKTNTGNVHTADVSR